MNFGLKCLVCLVSMLIAHVALAQSTYAPLVPARLMDTRSGHTTIDGQYAGQGSLASGSTTTMHVAGRGGLPESGLTAIVINLTAVNVAGPGYITVWSGTGAVPLSADINTTSGLTINNLAICPVSASGDIAIYNGNVAALDLVVDLQGYFAAGSSYNAIPGARLLDTRS